MNPELLQKYIAGNATEVEKQRVTGWIQENPENMREYMAQRKLHDMALWRTEPVAEENSRERKHFSLRGICMEAAKIAAVLAIVLLGTHYWTGKHQVPEDKTWQSIYVPAGQRAELMLADGTKVWLNSRSTLTFPGSFKGDIRNVKLDGEGYFAVTKNVEQPFIVETNKCNVKVLGTEFNVMAYAADSVWETSLLEGAVEILVPGSNNSGMRLEPNTMASLKGNRLVKGRIKEPDYFLWREGLLCFNDISVRDMIEKLKLYYGVDIVVNNTRILKNRYTGKLGQRKILRGISDKILSLCETNESSAIMETNGYRLLLPEGTLDYFNISDVKESSSEIVIYLEEKNELPGEYSTVKVESKGFYDPVVVRDFPIRGKNLFLNIRRRRWILKDEGRYVSRNWKLVAEGSRMTHEFASFLKELY